MREDGSYQTATFLHCPPHGTWEAEEDFDEVIGQLEA
jgi:hypothetical protein